MAKVTRTAERREDALSRERIVEAAIELLDLDGESGLTFRALATHLATGAGAIYWHVANKSELLVAASDAVVLRALADIGDVASPRKAIRKIAVALFDAIDAHPWIGAQLYRAPWQAAMLQVFERIGQKLQALEVPAAAQFTSASTLVSYIVGVSVQNATNARQLDPPVDRAEFLGKVADRWKALDAHEYPFTRKVAKQMREHDDREEFLAGIDLIISGVVGSRWSRER